MRKDHKENQKLCITNKAGHICEIQSIFISVTEKETVDFGNMAEKDTFSSLRGTTSPVKATRGGNCSMRFKF